MPLLAVLWAMSSVAGDARAQEAAPSADERAEEGREEGEEGEEGDVEEIARVLSNEAYLETRGRHCAGRGRSQWVVTQLLAAQHNPDGALNHLRVGACFPLIRTPGVLYDYTNIEFGLINDLSPSFVQVGGYLQVTPLSFLQLRVDSSGVVYWPLPTSRTGYNPVDGYGSRYDPAVFPKGTGTVATGWNFNFVANFRAKIPFNEVWALLVVNIFHLGYWDVGDANYYVNLRWDLILQNQDWMFNNEAMLGVESRFNRDFGMRYGFFDSFRHVPESGYDGHQVGIFAMGWWPNPSDAVWDLTPFVRAGMYIDHGFRAETFSIVGGVTTQYRLGDL